MKSADRSLCVSRGVSLVREEHARLTHDNVSEGGLVSRRDAIRLTRTVSLGA